MTLTVEKLHPLFVAEVTGVDLRAPLSDTAFAGIVDAFDAHSILVFRGQDITDDQQIAFSERFGALETMLTGSMGAGTRIADLSNVDRKTDAIIPPNDKRMVRNSANMLWHTDSSFKRVPARASLLSGREVPPVGGETEFAIMRAAYADLPEDRKQSLEGLIVEPASPIRAARSIRDCWTGSSGTKSPRCRRCWCGRTRRTARGRFTWARTPRISSAGRWRKAVRCWKNCWHGRRGRNTAISMNGGPRIW